MGWANRKNGEIIKRAIRGILFIWRFFEILTVPDTFSRG
jgi:hypothetical protein